MSINFFDQDCQTITNAVEFGLCDDPPPSNSPAYIDTINYLVWIAIVYNDNATEITFTAIDHCVDVRRADGEVDSRCDAMLTYKDVIIFVELKERNNRKWIKKSEDQLRVTIDNFKINHDISLYRFKLAYMVNKLKPNFQFSTNARNEKFRDDTGFILRAESKIVIS
jgi:hypothetical protein